MTNTDTPSGSDGDEDMQSTTGSAATVDGSYLAAASSRPLLLSVPLQIQKEILKIL